MSATSRQFAVEALRLLNLPDIPYRYSGTTLAGMDCQGMLKYCAQQLGVKLSYTGSNDMYRAACSWVTPLDIAKAQGRIVPGAVGFIVEYDGQEGDKYKTDGLGNASHVGIITMSATAYSVDASSSSGKVRGQSERDALRTWTHIGWLKALDYSTAVVVDEIGGSMDTAATPAAPIPIQDYSTIRTATVNTLDGRALNLRRAPSTNTDNRVGTAPAGAVVEVLKTRSDGWAKIRFEGIAAWVMARYLTMQTAAPQAAAASVASAPAQPQSSPLDQYIPTGKMISIPETMAYELYATLDA
ncbi:MAG: SH3 domain-containing protein, partial [Oscillospiraceae bacterium]|nr:SH3 domain-containing protein [Oscillospiraceae bacterium]